MVWGFLHGSFISLSCLDPHCEIRFSSFLFFLLAIVWWAESGSLYTVWNSPDPILQNCCLERLFPHALVIPTSASDVLHALVVLKVLYFNLVSQNILFILQSSKSSLSQLPACLRMTHSHQSQFVWHRQFPLCFWQRQGGLGQIPPSAPGCQSSLGLTDRSLWPDICVFTHVMGGGPLVKMAGGNSLLDNKIVRLNHSAVLSCSKCIWGNQCLLQTVWASCSQFSLLEIPGLGRSLVVY